MNPKMVSLWAVYRDTDVPIHRHSVDSELEILMQQAPGAPSDHVGSLPRQDTELGDALFSIMEEILTDREQYVVNAWVYEGLGVRAIGEQLSLSKSQVHRILIAALKKLRVQLASSPAIQSWGEGRGIPELEIVDEAGD